MVFLTKWTVLSINRNFIIVKVLLLFFSRFEIIKLQKILILVIFVLLVM